MNERIKELRKSLDITQQEFAKRIGSTQNIIASYEIGRRNPSSAVVNNICKEFNVNEEWLRTGQGEMFNSFNKDFEIAKWLGSVMKDRPDNFKKRLLAVLSNLNEDEWHFLEEKAKELVSNEFTNSQSSENISDEISATEEKISPKYENMTLEEIQKQADFWDSLYEKKQVEKSSASQKQEENFRNMA